MPAVAAFLASYLAFALELVAAKLLLPSFGGAAYVWTTSVMIFEGLIVLAYLFARRVLKDGRYGAAHLWVLAGGALFFPIAVQASPGAHPAWALAAALTLAISGPYFALSTTTPVVQRWLGAGDGYHLFAASNAGALLALLSYPTVVEPHLAVRAQLRGFELLYGVLAVLLWLCRPKEALPLAPSKAERSRPLMWLALSAGPSAAMLAVTTLLTLDLAAVPLLWVVPLSLYLLTFVLNFKRRPWRPRASLATAFALAGWVLLVVLTARFSADLPEGWRLMRRLWVVNQAAFYCAALFLVCLITHRALYDSKPAEEEASDFYLWVALGGWAGSALVGIAMPVLARHSAMPELDWAIAGALCLGACWAQGRHIPRAAREVPRGAVAALAVLGALGLGAYLKLSPAFSSGRVLSLRNFYGFYRVVDEGGFRKLYHGNTLHGMESLDPARAGEPLLYFSRGSPLFEVFARFGPKASRVGVLGLGAGTMAVYGRPGQDFDFYELDPDMADIARRDFSYLKESPARVSVMDGDGRLSLSRAQDARYGLLIVDVFSGDAIPVHMLTMEALRLYLSRLSPGGVVVYHVTNRFLDLQPVLAAEAAALGLSAAAKSTSPELVRGEERYYGFWVAVAPDAKALSPLLASGWRRLSGSAVRPWTDDYASLWAALKG